MSCSSTHDDRTISDRVSDGQSVSAPSVRIFCFTWNTESVRIAETMQHSGQEPLSVVSEQWFRCQQPDFLPELLRRALPSEQNTDQRAGAEQAAPYDILVFALQESAKPGDYLLSDAIPRELGSRYRLLKRSRLMGVGKTTYTSLTSDYELKLRGVRIAVFVREDFASQVTLVGDAWLPCPGRERLTHGKGCVAVMLRVADIGVIGFLNAHLPFDSSTIKTTNRERMESGVAFQNQALNALIEGLRQKYATIHYLFVMGDLNYRVLHESELRDARTVYRSMSESVEERQRVYRMRDELRQSIEFGVIPPLQEGIDDEGPTFMPTAKMCRGRFPAGSTTIDAYNLGKTHYRNPAWCDRILYATHRDLNQTLRQPRPPERRGEIVEGDGDILCLMYDRFEAGRTMTMSDHSGVIAAFRIVAFLDDEEEDDDQDDGASDENESVGS